MSLAHARVVILTTFKVKSVLGILHLRMRRQKLPYDFDDSVMRPSVALPAPTHQISTTFDHVYGSYDCLKAQRSVTSK